MSEVLSQKDRLQRFSERIDVGFMVFNSASLIDFQVVLLVDFKKNKALMVMRAFV
ncbi:hypothetical protein VOI54_05730 [Tamlana sp. 2201CG12-4]|uniref:hypothetical protein n=1 Tax=Tamlana sp. 2201CG12-4 TaxID=3112582 RepID=UPI002DBE1033|nr:hypothetical protein [Tamlana sp. 2201CG12-4]MEC3906508.1 hypothetical protein [Tamlana sp. 2201CG12-4]